jgi:hypothetical protein
MKLWPKARVRHVQPDYLRSEIDRLRFGTARADDFADGERSQPLQP